MTERACRMSADRTVETFLEYFRERGHRRVTGASLLPPPGDRVLFTTSGMHPLIRYAGSRCGTT
jgi:alanyl-tRNA synthetase